MLYANEDTNKVLFCPQARLLIVNIPRRVELLMLSSLLVLPIRIQNTQSIRCLKEEKKIKNRKPKTKTVKIYEAIIPKVILVSLPVILKRYMHIYSDCFFLSSFSSFF